MKLESKYFDSIRVKPRNQTRSEPAEQNCQWRGCEKSGPFKAPRGRGHEGEYLNFCMDHVRAYNKSYNYFNGMSEEDFIDYQKSAMTGHRPTWTMGNQSRAAGRSNKQGGQRTAGFDPSLGIVDPLDILSERAKREDSVKRRRRPIRNMERKSLRQLHLDDTATSSEIKARFKELVKRHHPDSNGGDRGSEDKLREVIQAYNYLKKTGLC